MGKGSFVVQVKIAESAHFVLDDRMPPWPSLGLCRSHVTRVVCPLFFAWARAVTATGGTSLCTSATLTTVTTPVLTTLPAKSHWNAGAPRACPPLQQTRAPFQFISPHRNCISRLHTSSVRSKGRRSKRVYVRGHNILGTPKKNPILKHRRVLLIDESGANLGEVDSNIALGMAEGKGLQVKSVDEGGSNSLPVFKMFNQQSLYEEKKAKKKKTSPHDVMKEVKIGTKISEHDLEVKVRQMRANLEKGYSLRVIVLVRPHGKFIPPDQYEEEMQKRQGMMDSLEKRLSDVAKRAKEGQGKGKDENLVAAIFRAVKPAVNTAEAGGGREPDGEEVAELEGGQ